MDRKDRLTNEEIAKKFPSQFALVSYSIKLAENMILTGRDSRVKSDSQNRATQVLCEILNGKDKFDEIIVDVHEDIVPEHTYNKKSEERMSSQPASMKTNERKKSRKVLAD
jgi:DNA-directed RNA polymerase subunit omega